MPRKHAHYFRSVEHLSEIDIYRMLDLFGVTDQALGHAIKKLVAPGGRGAGKDFRKDVQEAIDTLQRRLEMLDEDARVEKAPPMFVAWSGLSDGRYPVGVHSNTRVEVRLAMGGTSTGTASDFEWRDHGAINSVIAYRVLN
jgi:hypothetical protein